MTGTLLSGLTIILLLLAAEVGLRAYQKVTKKVPFSAWPSMQLDAVLGWKGYGVFGDPTTRRRKLAFVGDSYTLPLELDIASMCYSVLGRTLDVEVFAYGGGGYGTLQELLVLERFLLLVRPDFVVLQVCSNDFINNSWELENSSAFNNNLARRPYLVGDDIEYRAPWWFSPMLAGHFRLPQELAARIGRVRASLARRGMVGTVEATIEHQGLYFLPFRQAVDTTDRLVARIKTRLDDVPLIAFPVDTDQPYLDQWRTIFRRHGVPFVEDAVVEIRDAEQQGVRLRISDGAHWNAVAHRICGEALARWLRENAAESTQGK